MFLSVLHRHFCSESDWIPLQSVGSFFFLNIARDPGRHSPLNGSFSSFWETELPLWAPIQRGICSTYLVCLMNCSFLAGLLNLRKARPMAYSYIWIFIHREKKISRQIYLYLIKWCEFFFPSDFIIICHHKGYTKSWSQLAISVRKDIYPFRSSQCPLPSHIAG